MTHKKIGRSFIRVRVRVVLCTIQKHRPNDNFDEHKKAIVIPSMPTTIEACGIKLSCYLSAKRAGFAEERVDIERGNIYSLYEPRGI